MRTTELVVAVDPTSGPHPSQLDDVIVTLVPESWNATRLVRAVGRSRDLLKGMVIIGWCGPCELRLVRGQDLSRLGRLADLIASARPEAVQRWLRLLATTAEYVGVTTGDTGGTPRDRHPA